MTYKVEFRPEVEKDLQNLDKEVIRRIFQKIKWLSENFEYITPEALKGDWKGKFKLAVGNYRVIYSVNYNLNIITVHLVGHRKDIYKS